MDELRSLDRMLRLERGVGATAVRNLPQTLAVFETHFPRFPVLPGVLLLSSLADLGCLLLREETGTDWRLASLGQARFRRYARPGDQLEIAVDHVPDQGGDATLSGSIRVDGHLIAGVRRLRFAQAGTAP